MTTADTSTFGRLLKRKREREGLSMRAAADTIGVGTNTYFRAEHGGGVSGDSLLKLAGWLDVPPTVAGGGNGEGELKATMEDFEVLDQLIESVNAAYTALGGEGAHPLTGPIGELRARWAART